MHNGVALGIEEALRFLVQTRQLVRDDEAATFGQFAETSSDDPTGLLAHSERWLRVNAFGRELDDVQRTLTRMLTVARRPLPTGVHPLEGASAWIGTLAPECDGARRETLRLK